MPASDPEPASASFLRLRRSSRPDQHRRCVYMMWDRNRFIDVGISGTRSAWLPQTTT